MVIAQDVFVLAMDLMDQESDDGTFTGYPDEYKKKSWSILTVLQAELLPSSIAPIAVNNENTVLQIDDRTAINTLPYGLAAHLLMNEDQNKASFFNSRYDEMKIKRPATTTTIKDSYWEGTTEPSNQSTMDIDRGSFLDSNNVIYDRGEF